MNIISYGQQVEQIGHQNHVQQDYNTQMVALFFFFFLRRNRNFIRKKKRKRAQYNRGQEDKSSFQPNQVASQ